MAWNILSSWYAKGRQYFQSLRQGVQAAQYIFQGAARGKPLSEVLKETSERFGVDLTGQQLRRVTEAGEIPTPRGPVAVTPEMVKESVAGKIPQDWLDALVVRKVKLLDKPNIFGRWMHYKVQVLVWEEYQTAEGERRTRIKPVWATVATDKPLTRGETVARATELVMREPDWQVPASGEKGIVGIPEIHPYQYLPEEGQEPLASGEVFLD